jgi:pyridoxal biosynthesis lyase PdxS
MTPPFCISAIPLLTRSDPTILDILLTIAEEAGAVAVMALERVPSDIRAAGGVARMANPKIVEEVMNAVSIPVMAKARIGHITEASFT